MNARNSHSLRPALRRGNTIILVVGILVLLVIIATAFVVRTQAGRTTSAATTSFNLSNDGANGIAQNIAEEVSGALFVRAIDFSTLGLPLDLRVGANSPRFPTSPFAVKFVGDDQDNDGNGRADYPYNQPPHAVVPFTNWPDPGTTLDNWGAIALGTWPGGNGAVADWAFGDGNPTVTFPHPSVDLRGEFNPLGNPGDGDARWLRDIEPLRWDTDGDGIPDAFSHWRHMTNIARADNGWRAVFDISDVGDSDGNGYGRLATDLNVPFEQFLAIRHNFLDAGTGDTNLFPLGLQNFVDRWGSWMGVSPGGPNSGIGGYINAYRDPALIPPNLLRLRDLDADGAYDQIGERPQDEFAGPGVLPGYPAGAPRWFVNRILADADGDGYTDSFWFLAPSSVQSGIRTLVAVSVIDNQGMLNADVATRFIRADSTGIPHKTAGHSPSDIALVGQLRPIANGNFNVGFYDTWDSWFGATPTVGPPNNFYPQDETQYWTRHLQQVGLTDATNAALVTPSVAERLDYWRRSASRPLSSDPFAKYTPFGLEDELELRMYSGQNYPWILSRLEFSVGGDQNDTILRTGLGHEESSEFIDQLFNRQLVRDQRHRQTVYNGVRNDIAVPWLWLYGANRDIDGDSDVDAFDQRLFHIGAQKFDLRLPYDTLGASRPAVLPFAAAAFNGPFSAWLSIGPDVVGSNSPTSTNFVTGGWGGYLAGVAPRVFVPGDWDQAAIASDEFTPNSTALQFGIAVRDRLTHALIDFGNLPSARGTYYGNSPADVGRTLELAAAYAANIAQWRERDVWLQQDLVTEVDIAAMADPDRLASYDFSPLSQAVPVSNVNGATTTRFMGLEVQPFLVEAFIGHIYTEQYGPIPPTDAAGNPYDNAGQLVVNEDDPTRSTVVAVQIANPFNRPINFNLPPNPTDEHVEYRVRLFGQEFLLDNLGQATPDTADGILPPASEDRPSTLILYAIQDAVLNTTATEVHDKWIDFLDIQPADHPAGAFSGTRIVRVPTANWSVDSRSTYDTVSTESAVEIQRRYVAPGGVAEPWVTIDRFDPPTSRRFGDAVNNMAATAPAPPAPLPPATWIHGNPAGQAYPGLSIGVDGSGFNHWVQWVRATRAWGVDVDADGEIDPNEVNPRFVFGDYAVATALGDPADPFDAADTNTFLGGGDRYKFADDPDDTAPWFTRPYTRESLTLPGTDEIVKRKPTFFDMNRIDDPAQTLAPPQWSFPDKGWYGQKGVGTPDDVIMATITPPPGSGSPFERNYATPFAFQMLQKDDDFEQVGELLNVFLYGHSLQFTSNDPTGTFSGTTTTTFSEYLSDANSDLTSLQDTQVRYRTNRLLVSVPESGDGGQIIGKGETAPLIVDDPRHAIPDQPAGVRVLDAFVCDSFGCAPLFDFNGSGSTLDEAQARSLYNSKNFDGSSSPGMINVNTAPQEVMRAAPMMMRMVHETGGTSPGNPFYNAAGQPLVTTAPNAAAHLPRVMIPESLINYRERYDGLPSGTGFEGAPNYALWDSNNDGIVNNADNDRPRGLASIGDLLRLTVRGQTDPFIPLPANNGTDNVYPEQFSMTMGVEQQFMQVNSAQGNKPFYNDNTPNADQISLQVSTDRQGVWDPFAGVAGTPRVDYVAGDAEEANALFAGISNLVTTRSDVFTVYMKIRTFRQNTSVSPPRWDATNSEYIVDDSRYVMLVDRSGVNKPGDQPKILYMEKLPN